MCIDITRYSDALHLWPVLRISKHLLSRHHASTNDGLFVIDIVDEQIKRLHALAQALVQRLPFGSRDDARNNIERDQTFSACFAAVNSESNTDAAKHQIGFYAFARDDISRLLR